MATRLYLHAAANDVAGTFTGVPGFGGPNWTTTNGNTLRKMDTSIGASQTSLSGASLAQTNQSARIGVWVSPPLSGAQTINSAGNIVFNGATAQSNTSMAFRANHVFAYVWRPSTGAQVGSFLQSGVANPNMTTTAPTSAASEQVDHGTDTTENSVSASDGDVIIIEVMSTYTQSMATSYTGTFYYDGTTTNTTENAVVSNHASYWELAQDLTFQTPAPPTPVPNGMMMMGSGV